MSRPPLPPFSHAEAAQKVRMAEDAWNTRDPEKVAQAYTPDTKWRNWSEFHDANGQWYRAHGNENWEFDAGGYMAVRHASINDVPITAAERLFHWPQGPRPADHPGLTALGL